MTPDETALRRVPLHDLHAELGAKFVGFAGYEMPVQYPTGILTEHLHTRAEAGLFDVSHMGQIRLSGPATAEALEALVPGDIKELGVGATRYTLLLNDKAGIRDDLMVTNRGDHLFLIVNAATKEADLAHLQHSLPSSIAIEPMFERALLALQGPGAAAVIGVLAPDLTQTGFMTGLETTIGGIPVWATRSGYTGEDGFEISVAPDLAEPLARKLLADSRVKPIGLGARDLLRLEAGLCLYGHDLDEATTPVEGGLSWTIGKRRRQEGGFAGAKIVLEQLVQGPVRRRVGIVPEGKAPAREGTEIVANGAPVGTVTSGGFGPSFGGPVAMGYVAASAAKGAGLELMVRGTPRPAKVASLPFVPHRYFRG